MSPWSDFAEQIRRIILMQDKIDRLADGVSGLSDQIMDHEKRLIRIETMIEMAQEQSGKRGPRRLD